MQSAIEPTNINIVAAINTDGTVAISYFLSGPDYADYPHIRTGVRLTNGDVVTLQEYGIVRVEEAPVLEAEPIEPDPEPVEPAPEPETLEPEIVDPTPEPEPVAPSPEPELPVETAPEPEPTPESPVRPVEPSTPQTEE
jgi:hypothetical protein